jgi:hypothetical protein
VETAPTLGASKAATEIAQRLAEIERVEIRTVVEILDSPVEGNQVDTIPVSQPSSPASMAATPMKVGRPSAGENADSFGAVSCGGNHVNVRTSDGQGVRMEHANSGLDLGNRGV